MTAANGMTSNGSTSTSSSSSRDYHIVEATRDDIPDILRIIKELALYEKEPDAVKCDEQMLTENIFEKGYAGVLLAKEGSEVKQGAEVIGMALYFFSFSTWLGVPGLYLEDLYVTESRRNGGIGKALFARLGKLATERKCGRLEWRVLKWNKPSIGFYEQVLGATPQSEWEGMRLEGEEIKRLEKWL